MQELVKTVRCLSNLKPQFEMVSWTPRIKPFPKYLQSRGGAADSRAVDNHFTIGAKDLR